MIVTTRTHDYTLDCDINSRSYQGAVWYDLVETVAGQKPRLFTKFCMQMSTVSFYFTFVCEDDYQVSNMTRYNDKLYNEDVVEVFIAKAGNVGRYIELEVSPKGVLFAGLVRNNLKGSRRLKLYPRPIATACSTTEDGQYIVQLVVAKRVVFGKLNARVGDKLVGNAYRIDRPMTGCWELSAINPTKAEAFHKPEYFVSIMNREI